MKSFFSLISIFILCFNLTAQESLDEILGPSSNSSYPVSSTFSSTRIINGHSVEMIPKNVGELRISHRFGPLENGFYDIFGLDQAQIRIGYDYGLNDNVMVGFGRSSYKKTYDIFSRFAILRQTSDNSVPLSIQYLFSASIETLKYGKKIPFMQRLGQINQILIAKKMNNLSVQITPSLMIHEYFNYDKKIFTNLGVSARYLVGKRVAINLEYFHRLKHDNDGSQAFNDIFEMNYNSLGIGVDIETGGHVFQFHFSNSSAMNEQGFLFESDKSWGEGEICFGFNILREFSRSKKSKGSW